MFESDDKYDVFKTLDMEISSDERRDFVFKITDTELEESMDVVLCRRQAALMALAILTEVVSDEQPITMERIDKKYDYKLWN